MLVIVFGILNIILSIINKLIAKYQDKFMKCILDNY
jgi:hypothetical protein